jgi:hypothetical protein
VGDKCRRGSPTDDPVVYLADFEAEGVAAFASIETHVRGARSVTPRDAYLP